MLSIPLRSTTDGHVSFQYCGSAIIYFPITFTVIAEMKKPVLRIMPFTASWTFEITAPRCSLAVVILRNGKRCPATARDEKHFKLLGFVLSHRIRCCCEYTVARGCGRWARTGKSSTALHSAACYGDGLTVTLTCSRHRSVTTTDLVLIVPLVV